SLVGLLQTFDVRVERPLEPAAPLRQPRALILRAQVGAPPRSPSLGIRHDPTPLSHEPQQLGLRARAPAADAASLGSCYRSSSLCSSGSESAASSSPSVSVSANSGS